MISPTIPPPPAVPRLVFEDPTRPGQADVNDEILLAFEVENRRLMSQLRELEANNALLRADITRLKEENGRLRASSAHLHHLLSGSRSEP